MLKNISTVDFRNLANINLEFCSGINVILGKNGQGKTNLLEAIYFISVLRSFRYQQIKNLIRWDKRSFQLKGTVYKNGITTNLQAHYGEKRKLLVDGYPVSKASNFFGRIFCVSFVPEDIELVEGPASEKRRFFDITLSQTNPGYLKLIQDYQKSLKLRNLLLKSENPNIKSIRSFDRILVETGSQIIYLRIQLCKNLSRYIEKISSNVLQPDEKLELLYEFSYNTNKICFKETLAEIKDKFSEELSKNFPKDIRYRFTNIGPHRDGFSLLLSKKRLQSFGSKGQCRLSVIILKMAVVEYLLQLNLEPSVVFLIDDVMGELDMEKRISFISMLERAEQVFYACTEIETALNIKPASITNMNQGIAKRV